jgi:RsiW-degrading membrane proteinase PrsW (M82 family)
MPVMPLRRTWLRTLIGGAAIYALVTGAAESTENIHLLPAVLMLGALLVPVTFVVYLFERLAVDPAILPTLAVCFWAGGSVGVAAAGFLEYQTLRDLGTLPMLAVGVIEESVKLALPLWLLSRGRFTSPGAGLLFGVASGMGFAALETMGYGLVALIQSGGHIGPAEDVLLIRGLLSPVGHAAWTGLVCAALWRRPRSWPLVAAAFATAVSLHASWDSTGSILVHVAIGTLSGALLAASVRRARLARPRIMPAAA